MLTIINSCIIIAIIVILYFIAQWIETTTKLFHDISKLLDTNADSGTEAILKFRPLEDSTEFRSAINGADWQYAMWQLNQKLRHMTKYEGLNYVEIDGIRELIYEIMEGQNLTWDNL